MLAMKTVLYILEIYIYHLMMLGHQQAQRWLQNGLFQNLFEYYKFRYGFRGSYDIFLNVRQECREI